MNTVYFLVQQTMFFSIPLLIVALGGMFSERSGVVNIALEGIMIMGAFSSILFINIVQSSGAALPPQLLLLLAVLIAAAVGVLVSMAHAYASINMKADQVISGTAINMFAPAFAIFAARMIRSVQQIPFSNTFRITKVPVLGDIPVLGPLLFQNTYITTYLGFAVLAVSAVVLYKTRFGLRLRACGEHPQAADGCATRALPFPARWQAWAALCLWCQHPPTSTPQWPATAFWRWRCSSSANGDPAASCLRRSSSV